MRTDALTAHAARVMHLPSYGIEVGHDASFVLLQARARLKVWRKGRIRPLEAALTWAIPR